jgi:hypothetical protein
MVLKIIEKQKSPENQRASLFKNYTLIGGKHSSIFTLRFY